MKKEYKTLTYGQIPLKLDTEERSFFPKGVEVKAEVNFETGEITFKLSEEHLNILRDSQE